jgi:hypothetical protein
LLLAIIHPICTRLTEEKERRDLQVRMLTCRCELANLETELPLEFDLTCGTARCEVKIVAQTGGLYSCTFVASAPGFYRLLVTSLGKPLQNSPVSIQVTLPSCRVAEALAMIASAERIIQASQRCF